MNEVLVTGAGGFIGSWVCQKLIENGFKVRALCRYTSSNSIGWLDHYKNKNNQIFIEVFFFLLAMRWQVSTQNILNPRWIIFCSVIFRLFQGFQYVRHP